MLKSQDILILVHLSLSPGKWTYAQLAEALCMSASEVHAGIKRAELSRLFNPYEKEVNRRAFSELLRYGVPYVYPAEIGGKTRGIKTGYAAHPLCEIISQSQDLPPVWPWPRGNDVGYSFMPLFHSVPEASQKNEALYECLTLIDALRGGQARERKMAMELLEDRLFGFGTIPPVNPDTL